MTDTDADGVHNIIPGIHRPNANNMPSNINQNAFIGPNFKARPLKHWRRQLCATNKSQSFLITHLDRPGSTIYQNNQNVSIGCIDNDTQTNTDAEKCKNQFIIDKNKFEDNTFDNGIIIQNSGEVSNPLYCLTAPVIEEIYNDIPGAPLIVDIVYSPLPPIPDIIDIDPETPLPAPIPDPDPAPVECDCYEIITDVNNTVCIACNPENNRIRSGISTLSNAYYETTAGYLQSRCRTAAQRLSTTRKSNGVYYPTTNNNIPFVFLYPNDESNGPQVYQPKNCSNLRTYNNPTCNRLPNNSCNIIYKPNNTQFARQGAVSSASTRIQKLKSDTITNNGFSFYSAYGATMANAGFYQGTNTSSNYFVKTKNYPGVKCC